MNCIMNTLSKNVYIALLIITILFTTFTVDGLFYWMLENKFEIAMQSIRQKEIDWMICFFSFTLLY